MQVFSDLRPRTVAMSVLVTVEMFNALNNISEDGSLLAIPPWDNRWLLGAIATSVALHLLILYVAPLAALFGVTALSWREWRAVVALSAPVILVDEGLKAWGRRRRRRGGGGGRGAAGSGGGGSGLGGGRRGSEQRLLLPLGAVVVSPLVGGGGNGGDDKTH